MSLDPDLRALLVCPRCHGDLTDAPPHEEGAAAELQCPACGLGYAVGGDAIPDMLVDDARSLEVSPPGPGTGT